VAGPGHEMRHIDPGERVVGDEAHKGPALEALQRATQPQGGRGATVAAGVHAEGLFRVWQAGPPRRSAQGRGRG
jgi:hypothetical protein